MSRVAFVSGAGRGIGRAIAIRLAQDGYDVAINDIPASKIALEETATEIKKTGMVIFCPCNQILIMVLGRKVSVALADVSKRAEIERAIETTVTELGGLHVSITNDLRFSSSNFFALVKVMVANAGMCRIKPMLDITPDEWEQELSVNLTGMKLHRQIFKMMAHSLRHVLSVSASSEADD
jgi:NAD(P)-dependent dehydrogenase (short-subunit alcohol dehydrogenase family)